MKRILIITALLLWQLTDMLAFCGFYVAKADASLFNESSQVIIAREGNRSIITMSSDFKGDLRDFAMVVPVPVVLKEKDIRVAQRVIFDKMDAYSAPRLAEYYDQNPCYDYYGYKDGISLRSVRMESAPSVDILEEKDKDFGVTVEAQYTVGEYDILILSAEESDGLKQWLLLNDYQIPAKAEEVLDPYIKSGMKFFVAKVNLQEQSKTGFQTLRPIQVSFDSPKFMLPIRLGMANSKGTQDMIVYLLTKKGRVETVNYRTTLLPTDVNVPTFVQSEFGKFYQDLYTRQWKKEGRNTVMLEYAWDLSSSNYVKCDPCATTPPAYADLKEAGVFWLSDQKNNWGGSNYQGDVFFTRLHVRYGRANFPQDLVFQETPNKQSFQGRYVLQHPVTGELNCEAATGYYQEVLNRREKELHTLASLTGWSIEPYLWYTDEYASKAGVKQYNPYVDEQRNGIGMMIPDMGNGGGTPPSPFGLLALLGGLFTMLIVLGYFTWKRFSEYSYS